MHHQGPQVHTEQHSLDLQPDIGLHGIVMHWPEAGVFQISLYLLSQNAVNIYSI